MAENIYTKPLNDIVIRNSKSSSLFGAFLCWLLSLFLFWLYFTGRNSQLGTPIAAGILVLGSLLFIYGYYDREVKIQIAMDRIIIFSKEYFWKDVVEVKMKNVNNTGSNKYLQLKLHDNTKSKGYQIIDSPHLLGLDMSFNDIIMYAKIFKRLHDEKITGKRIATQVYREDSKRMDARRLEMLKKSNEELLEIINDSYNKNIIDYLNAKQELKIRSEIE